MMFVTDKIDRYRRMLRCDVSTVTRRSIEWLFVNALREAAGLEPRNDTEQDDLQGPSLTSVAGQALAEAVVEQGAQFGNIQLYLPKHDMLVMLVSRNFDPHFTDRFAFLCPDGRTACSRALASARRVILENVANDDLFAPHLHVARAAGFQAVQSTPLKLGAGVPFGVLSTHFASPRSFSEAELAHMDAHANDLSRELAREWA